jgi:hypothetical protein
MRRSGPRPGLQVSGRREHRYESHGECASAAAVTLVGSSSSLNVMKLENIGRGQTREYPLCYKNQSDVSALLTHDYILQKNQVFLLQVVHKEAHNRAIWGPAILFRHVVDQVAICGIVRKVGSRLQERLGIMMVDVVEIV